MSKYLLSLAVLAVAACGGAEEAPPAAEPAPAPVAAPAADTTAAMPDTTMAGDTSKAP